ncbi:MAG: hypothetical protein ACR2NN_18565 [Bryobacteraceae bacterium]
MERIDSKYEERTTEIANLLNRLTGTVVDLAHAMDGLERSQKQLLTSQVILQERMEKYERRMEKHDQRMEKYDQRMAAWDERIEKLVSGFVAYMERRPNV